MNAKEFAKVLRGNAHNQEDELHICESTRNALKAADLIESLQAQLDSVMASNDRFDTDNSILFKERDAAIKEKERLRVELAYADAQINWDNDKRAELEDLLDAAIAGQETLQRALAESQRRERASLEFINELRNDDSGDWGDIMFRIEEFRVRRREEKGNE